jgi:hypothetical protein
MWPFNKSTPEVPRRNPVYLKVKLKSLAEEARIIKHEENKRKVPQRQRNVVKQEQLVEGRGFRAEDKARRAKRRSQPWYELSAQELHGLHLHRVHNVRREARLTQIAYGYLRGRDFKQVDSGNDLIDADWQRVSAMVKKYGDGVDTNVAKWAGVK